MQAVIGAIAWVVAKIFGDNVLRFIAGKAILTTLFILVLPIILNNLLYDLMNTLFTWVSGHTDTAGINPSQSFTGLCAYMMTVFKVPDCMSVIISGMLLRVVLNLVPFLRI